MDAACITWDNTENSQPILADTNVRGMQTANLHYCRKQNKKSQFKQKSNLTKSDWSVLQFLHNFMFPPVMRDINLRVELGPSYLFIFFSTPWITQVKETFARHFAPQELYFSYVSTREQNKLGDYVQRWRNIEKGKWRRKQKQKMNNSSTVPPRSARGAMNTEISLGLESCLGWWNTHHWQNEPNHTELQR